MSEEPTKCIYCGEEINKDAIKCKHCGEWLNKEELKKIKEEETQKRDVRVLRNCFIAAVIIAAIVNLWEIFAGVKFSQGSGTFSHFLITTIVLTFVFFTGSMIARIFDKLSS